MSGLPRLLRPPRLPDWARLPDWTLYAAAMGVVLVTCLALAENADAPTAPVEAGESGPAGNTQHARLWPISPFGPEAVVDTDNPGFRPLSGTAFSIASDGRWITARHVVEGCRRPALMVGGDQALAADVRLAPHADVALMITQGAPTPLAMHGGPWLSERQLAFHPGFPQGRPGEVSSRLLGYERLRSHGRIRGHGNRSETVLAWAEVGRTRGLDGTLAGLSGAPVMDAEGRVVGVTIAASPRRGRIYTTTPLAFRQAIRGQVEPAEPGTEAPLTVQNYGRVADDLRRELRVAQVVCLG